MRRSIFSVLVLSAAACGPSADPLGAGSTAGAGPDAYAPVATDTASVAAPTQPHSSERFGYALDVSASFKPQPAPHNDDGRAFRFSGGDATLTVFGYNNALARGLDGLANQARDGIDSLRFKARDDDGVGARLRDPTGQNQGESWAEIIDASLRWTE